MHGLARDLLCTAERVTSGEAVLAAAAGRPQRLHAHPVTRGEGGDALAEGGDPPDEFVPGHDRGEGRHAWPVALHHVQVGAADPAGANPDKHLPGPGSGSPMSARRSGCWSSGPGASSKTAFTAACLSVYGVAAGSGGSQIGA